MKYEICGAATKTPTIWNIYCFNILLGSNEPVLQTSASLPSLYWGARFMLLSFDFNQTANNDAKSS